MTDVTLFGVAPDDWLAALKPYQQDAIRIFLEKSGPEAAAQKWLASSAAVNIAQFGGSADSKPYYEFLKNEFDAFLCDENQSKEEKAQYLKISDPKYIVSSVSSIIGVKIGYAAAAIAPLIVLLFMSAGKIGLNAYCKQRAANKAAAAQIEKS